MRTTDVTEYLVGKNDGSQFFSVDLLFGVDDGIAEVIDYLTVAFASLSIGLVTKVVTGNRLSSFVDQLVTNRSFSTGNTTSEANYKRPFDTLKTYKFIRSQVMMPTEMLLWEASGEHQVIGSLGMKS